MIWAIPQTMALISPSLPTQHGAPVASRAVIVSRASSAAQAAAHMVVLPFTSASGLLQADSSAPEQQPFEAHGGDVSFAL